MRTLTHQEKARLAPVIAELRTRPSSSRFRYSPLRQVKALFPTYSGEKLGYLVHYALKESGALRRLSAEQTDLDSLSEMGEMESLRLQMAMDRMSKSMSTLSNVLRKTADTQATITRNIK